MDRPSGEYRHPRTAGIARNLANILYVFKFQLSFWHDCSHSHVMRTASRRHFWIRLHYRSLFTFRQGVQGFLCWLWISFRRSCSFSCRCKCKLPVLMSTDWCICVQVELAFKMFFTGHKVNIGQFSRHNTETLVGDYIENTKKTLEKTLAKDLGTMWGRWGNSWRWTWDKSSMHGWKASRSLCSKQPGPIR